MMVATAEVTTLVLLMSLGLCAPAHGQELSRPTAIGMHFLIPAFAADAATAEVGFAYGATEGNPLVRGPLLKRAAVFTASTAAIYVAAKKLDRRHPKWAAVGTWAAVGLEIAAASWNLWVIQDARSHGCPCPGGVYYSVRNRNR